MAAPRGVRAVSVDVGIDAETDASCVVVAFDVSLFEKFRVSVVGLSTALLDVGADAETDASCVVIVLVLAFNETLRVSPVVIFHA